MDTKKSLRQQLNSMSYRADTAEYNMSKLEFDMTELVRKQQIAESDFKQFRDDIAALFPDVYERAGTNDGLPYTTDGDWDYARLHRAAEYVRTLNKKVEDGEEADYIRGID